MGQCNYIPHKQNSQHDKYEKEKKMSTLLEITLNKLNKSTIDAFPDTKKRQNITGSVNVSRVKFIPFKSSNALKIEAETLSGTNKHQCSMVFDDVFYEESDSNQTKTFKGVDDENYHIHQLDRTINDVKVSCSCMDFQFRFARSNFSIGGLDGNPPPTYVKKTDRPDVNPKSAPGMCKHLIKLTDHLQLTKLLS